MKWFLIYMVLTAGSVQSEFKEVPDEQSCELFKAATIEDFNTRLPKSYEFLVVCTEQVDRNKYEKPGD